MNSYRDDLQSEYIHLQQQQQSEQKRLLKSSIRKKFLLLCILLVVIMTVSISTMYFVMTQRDKQRQSQQRLQVAFDMVLHEFRDQIGIFSRGFEEFLKDSKSLRGAASTSALLMENPQAEDQRSLSLSYLLTVTEELTKFAHIMSASRLIVYGADASVLALYQLTEEEEETVGLSTISSTGNQTYLALDDPALARKMLSGQEPIPDALFPFGVPTHFYDEIPPETSVSFFHESGKFGLRIIAPVYNLDNEIVGVLLGDIFYSQGWIEEYAELSRTHLNLFIGDELSIGSLPEFEQLEVDPEAAPAAPLTLDELRRAAFHKQQNDILTLSLQGERYYQGRYQFIDDYGTIYTLTASVSKTDEERAMQRVLASILTISVVTIIGAALFSISVSRKSMSALHHIVNVIGSTASGNLQHTTPVLSFDEFGLIAIKLNEMISRLRDVSLQTKAVSSNVTGTADSILREVEMLFVLMEQQIASVDNTAGAVEGIDRFIDLVVADITKLLDITQEILTSLQKMSNTTQEVATSTTNLNENLSDISSFSEHVTLSSEQIASNASHLLQTVQETEHAVQQIAQSLNKVSENTQRSQQLSQETLDAALEGQRSVATSIEGIVQLKDVVAKSAQIMNEVNTRSEQVSAILDFVDEIAERTALLSLNASIISAQAGESGRSFAVIADEIRELSTQTRSSTKEIYKVINSLRRETQEGVKSVSEGLRHVDQGIRLADVAKSSLTSIIQRASQSSDYASHTVQMTQETASSAEVIQQAMNTVTEMTSDIQSEIQKEQQNFQQVANSIDNIRTMSEQVKQANYEQSLSANAIEKQMQMFVQDLGAISEQTHQLQTSSDQIVDAMRKIEEVTEKIRHNMNTLSEHTINKLVRQSDDLKIALNVFQAE